MSLVQEFYRKDVDGLRAIAILSVVAYHSGIPGVPGGFVGVDVFFVISGYLITSLLLAEARRDGTISLRQFYARRIRRLFPALFVVVCVTLLIGAFALLPIFNQQQGLAKSAIATALYVSNIYFWKNSPGYFDQSSDLMPLLHTWSLSVEEQFYLIWPFMVLAVLGLARRSGISFDRSILTVILVTLVSSFVLCVIGTTSNPTAAFYLLPHRAWELATGAALAVALPRVGKPAPVLGAALSAGGLIAILAATVVLREDESFPGYQAALPVFGTAMVIAGGALSPGNPLQRGLSLRPMVFIGLLSYSWYLWHWPVLALTRAYFLQEFSPARDVAFGVMSIIPAYLSYRWIENPIRYARTGPFRRTETTLAAGALISLAMCIAAVMLLFWARVDRRSNSDYPAIAAAAADTAPLNKCHISPPSGKLPARDKCSTGAPGVPVSAVLWGDSHADHLSPLLQAYSETRGDASFLVRTFNGCGAAGPSLFGEMSIEYCTRLRGALFDDLKPIAGKRPGGVILARRWLRQFHAPRISQPDLIEDRKREPQPWRLNDQVVTAALIKTLDEVNELGLRVLVVAPMPEMRFNVPNCLARRSPVECSVPRLEVERQRAKVMAVLTDITRNRPNVRVWDPIDALCNKTECPATRDGVILFKDDDHLTATTARSALESARPFLEWVSTPSTDMRP